MLAQKIRQCLLAAVGIAIAAPTVHLAGDSTMATTDGTGGTQGWGTFLKDHINLVVDNNAIGGRSARSFTREGRFTAMAAEVKKDDYVIIAFGHNDGGGLHPDNGRSDCGVVNGNYATTCETTFNGVPETVQTYYTYLFNAVKLFQSKGANVIVASQTCRNVWQDGVYAYTPSSFVGYARDVAAATGATFVDHGLYMAALYHRAGSTTVNSYYPRDQLHTSPAGAGVAATAFVLGLDASNNSLRNHITHR